VFRLCVFKFYFFSVLKFLYGQRCLLMNERIMGLSIYIRRFVCVCVCPLMTLERNGRLPPNFQGSSGTPQDLFYVQKFGSRG